MNKENIKREQKNFLNERLESERLQLVPISRQYKDNIFKELTEDITTYMYPAPAKDISETEEFISESQKGLTEGNTLQLVVLAKATGIKKDDKTGKN